MEIRYNINLKEKIATINNSNSMTALLFLKGRFKEGGYLGFYSCNPTGRVHDMDTGWKVIDDNGIEIDSFETKSYGICLGGYNGLSFNEWRRSLKDKYGRLTRFVNSNGEDEWRLKSD